MAPKVPLSKIQVSRLGTVRVSFVEAHVKPFQLAIHTSTEYPAKAFLFAQETDQFEREKFTLQPRAPSLSCIDRQNVLNMHI